MSESSADKGTVPVDADEESELPIDADAAGDGPTAEPKTIHIGLGAGLGIVVLVTALATGMLFARLNQPAPTVIVVPAPTAAVVTIDTEQGEGGEMAPGQVLEVSDVTHPLMHATAPEITGAFLDGTATSVSAHVGKPLVLNFWATWCPPCRMEMPWLEEAYAANKDKGLVLLGVDAGEKVAPEAALDMVRSFVNVTKLSFPVLMPENAMKAQYDYQVFGLPSTYFIGSDGKVTDVIRGAFPNRATLDARIAAYWQEWEANAPAGTQ